MATSANAPAEMVRVTRWTLNGNVLTSSQTMSNALAPARVGTAVLQAPSSTPAVDAHPLHTFQPLAAPDSQVQEESASSVLDSPQDGPRAEAGTPPPPADPPLTVEAGEVPAPAAPQGAPQSAPPVVRRVIAGSSYFPGPTYYPAGSPYIRAGASYVPRGTSYIPATSSYIHRGTSYISAASSYIPRSASYFPATSSYIPHGTSYLPAGSSYFSTRSSYLPDGALPRSTSIPITAQAWPTGVPVHLAVRAKGVEQDGVRIVSYRPLRSLDFPSVLAGSPGDVTTSVAASAATVESAPAAAPQTQDVAASEAPAVAEAQTSGVYRYSGRVLKVDTKEYFV
eukprot:GGOE01036521.1.p1 GENE.GGOE01036521.1~~GGOE01036521.1.p1  ORF type:complete len:350 (-),score=55.89 GGOE01036521.1:248-1264(-)